MSKGKHLAGLPAAIMALFLFSVSCEREAIPEGIAHVETEMTFTATYGEQAKSVLGEGGTVLWAPSDAVSVFNGAASGGGSRFTSGNADFAEVVDFVGYLKNMPGGGNDFWAVYPYKESNSCDGQSITTALSASQTALAGSFALGGHPTIAHSSGKNLSFFALAGGLAFSFSRSDIRSVTIRGNAGEALAGTIRAKSGTNGVPVILAVSDKKTEVTLTAAGGFVPGAQYAVSLLPASLKNGVTITLRTTDGKEGIIRSTKAQTVKRGVFGRIPGALDAKVTSWESVQGPVAGGGTQSGLYLGILGFNEELYAMPIERLDASSKGRFDAFIDKLSTKSATLLYYSSDEALKMLDVQYPDNLFRASLVTFTDGLDQGSAMNYPDFPDDDQLLSDVHARLYAKKVAGLPLEAWTIGLRGNDVVSNADYQMFLGNLRQLARPETNAREVQDMSAVNARFQEIAQQLSQTMVGYSHDLTVTFPGKNNTRMRFTLDNVSGAEASKLYIEGTVSLSSTSMALTDVKYEGLHTWNTGTVYGERDGVRVRFQFRDVVVGDGSVQLSLSNIKHWLYVPSEGSWQRNSEFSAENNAAMQVTKTRKSSVVLLNLDCSTSLGGDFSNLTKHAKSFIATLYNAAVDASDVTGVSLGTSSKSLYVGDAATLQATVSPSSAANKTLLWASSAPSVARVSSSGTVTAVGVGSSVITATSLDGGLTASCSVTVKERPADSGTENGHAWVNMGLSVLWATCNVGASSPEKYGNYYAWGETTTQSTYSWSTYKYCKGSSSTLTKYCNKSNYGYNGYTDTKTVLDLEDDAARVNWGGSWRMPTDAEWTELRDTDNCIWTWTTQSGTNGYKVTSKKTGNSIFLPAAGYRYDSSLSHAGSYGIYWSSSLDTGNPSSACRVNFDSSEVGRYSSYRIGGRSVRPVTE